MAKVICLLLVGALVFAARPLIAAQPLLLQGNGIKIVFDAPLRPVAEQVVVDYPQLKGQLEGLFGWPLDFTPIVVLVKDRRRFQQMAGTDLVAAFAVPARNLVVIDYAQLNRTPLALEPTLKHELCHLLLHRYIDAIRLPRWLDEGLAQWASDGVAEVLLSTQGQVLHQAVLSGTVLPFSQLARRFPGDKRFLVLAYEQSKSFIEYLSRKFGRRRLLMLLENLKAGRSVKTAVALSFGTSLTALEKNWYTSLKEKSTWLVFLSGQLYEFLFFLGALLVVAGFVRHFRRKRAYREEDEGRD